MIAGDKKHILGTYNRFPVTLVRAKGSYAWDSNGKKYLDFFTGIAVHPLGHCHPSIVNAVRRQAGKLSHTTNLFYNANQVKLAALLTKHSFASKVAFANSGAEANELCIKLARLWGARKGRYKIVALKNSFHGRTYGALSATGQPAMQKPFGPMLAGFKHVPANDLNALKKSIDSKTAAIMLESVQGEGGVIPMDLDYLAAVRKLCDSKKILMILDEIQTGLGRTGKLWGYQHVRGLKPDLVSVGKSLGGGLPLSAVLVSKKCEALMGPGGHGTTMGGNPVSCAAGEAMFSTVLRQNLPARVEKTGRELVKGLMSLWKEYGIIEDIRGRGLMIGVVLDRPSAPIVNDLLKRGLLANATAGNVLRLLPPLNLKPAEMKEGLKIIGKTFSALKK